MSHFSSSRRSEMATLVLLILISSQVVFCSENYGREGFIDRLSNGMKFATDFLGSESVALKVAEFVVKAFQPRNKLASSEIRRPWNNEGYPDSEENFKQDYRPNNDVNEAANPMSPLKYLVRLLGLQPSQISAVAVNALVFVAQMISSFLAGNRRPNQSHRFDDPMTWILNKKSRNLQDLLAKAKNETLFDEIEQIVNNETENEEETSCIRLLACKLTPFVTKMQKTVFGEEAETNGSKVRGVFAMYRHLPSADEINARSDICEQKYKDCYLVE